MEPRTFSHGLLTIVRDVHQTFLTAQDQIIYVVSLFWLFTKDDFDTFVLPNTVFGTVAALAEAHCNKTVGNSSMVGHVLFRVPHTILFNWANLFIFDLANQRLPDSIAEDRLNKPWRPLPRGLLRPQTTSRIMLATMPIVLAGTYIAGTATETALLFVLTWMYNDLRGGDEYWILRNIIIAAAFFLYNLGSAKVAGGLQIAAGSFTWQWATVVSAIILTTMHIQDFKDQEGDRVRQRRTAPLVLGDNIARWTFAIPVACWSVICILSVKVALWYGVIVISMGAIVAWRCIFLRGRAEDRRTWKLWCLWCASIYGIPLAGQVSLACERTI